MYIHVYTNKQFHNTNTMTNKQKIKIPATKGCGVFRIYVRTDRHRTYIDT